MHRAPRAERKFTWHFGAPTPVAHSQHHPPANRPRPRGRPTGAPQRQAERGAATLGMTTHRRMGERRAHGVPQGEGSGQAVLEGWGGGSAARLSLVLDRRRRMGEGRAAGGPWGNGLGTGDLGRRRGGLNDVLPPLFSEINRIAVTVWNRPAFVRARHPVALQCHEIIVQLVWLLFTLACPPLA
jgi:hypothetical protein